MRVVYEPLNLFSDQRGILFEPLLAADFCVQKNAHIVTSMPGVIRGNHFHIKGVETVAVMGPALVRFQENGEITDVEISAQEVYRFVFPAGVPHAIKNLSREPNILVAFNTIEHDPKDPDTKGAVLL